MRFEKAQDPVNTVRGLARAVELLREISPGIRLVGGVADQRASMHAASGDRAAAGLAGAQAGPRRSSAAEVRRILERLAFGVTEVAARHLFGDGAELARHQGHLHQGRSGGRGRPHGGVRFDHAAGAAGAGRACRRRIPSGGSSTTCAVFSSDKGFTEVYNYTFLSEEAVRAFGLDPGGARARDQSDRLRPGADADVAAAGDLAATSLENAKHRESFRLFEIGLEIHKRTQRLPDEIPHLVAAIYDRQGDGAPDFRS